MNRNSTNSRQDVDFPRTHRAHSQQQGNHRCPHCSKSYRRATWLDNHIQTKHSTRLTREQSEMLAHISNNHGTSTSNSMLLSQSFQQTNRSALNVDLKNMLVLLKQLSPLMENLLPALEQLGGAVLDPHAMRRSDLRNPKRCASSPDLRGELETKRRELSVSMSEARVFGGLNDSEDCLDKTVRHLPSPAHRDDSNAAMQTTSRAALPERNSFKLDSPNTYPDHPRSSQELLSHSSTPFYQAPNNALPQRRRQSRLSPAPRFQNLSESSIQAPHEFLEWFQPPAASMERTPLQYEHSSMWSNPARLLLGSKHSKSDAQLQRFEDAPYQELDQHRSIMQRSQQNLPSHHQQASQHSFSDCLGDIFQDWISPNTPNPDSSDSTMSVAQLMRDLDKGDDRVHLDHSVFEEVQQ